MPRNTDQVLTVAAMRAAEQALIDAGASVESLMEMAGHGAGAYVHRVAGGRAVTILCGPGNNGGDGYVIARHLFERDVPVRVIAALPPKTRAALAARAAFAGPIIDGVPPKLPRGDVFVDCLFGSGLTRAVDADLFAMLSALFDRHHHRIAIDLPSGIESDSGAVLNPGLPAFDLTISLGAWKHAHFAMPSTALMGALRLIDIGCAAQGDAAGVLQRPRLGIPAPDAHKYRRGLLAIVGGAMPGATLLSASAARHAGAGYLRLIAGADPGPVPYDLVIVRETPAQALGDGRVAAVLVGPGLGRDPGARERLGAALAAGLPTVVDADGLVLLRPGQCAGAPMVLTPHEGELAALERAFGLRGEGVKHERALRLAAATGAVVLAKGPDSVIAAPDGRLILAPRASSWLSVAGTGDVLAGIVASRLAVHKDALRAACEGVWLHSEAAQLAGPAFAATDLAEWVPQAVRACL
ncbi:bifunctional ADP-dependent NAD(P)H-hydrate dehydratase/NAD(P)H-hydrate epimerase [Novosphingobium sp. Fuku2-ISO-50]|uniref:bifunctional ADP-dependent NAD(P)H-hydrate dehydratase/NAD(P)H-hydrate epimerase n=1 Tax=Novosphingobium sp. Fuku2-ISO-50 TaxID=1739114 RepID=UPI00076C7983|nr:bifunctional ADP-dependent NAD(P)H-hydrate dehydratase/NAD(P)H-hydrate epimerase [Novosphingobium sp. Fuku2-ISO-50]KUR77957.1 sugar kinase [Novosphingobium sp. Fuku2-ISO-50]